MEKYAAREQAQDDANEVWRQGKMPANEEIRRHVVAREREKNEESSDPQRLPFLKPAIRVSRFLHEPQKGIRSMNAQVDKRFGAPVVVIPHQTEHNRDDQSLVCIDIRDALHGVIRFPIDGARVNFSAV
jgi:hypothetical protein